MIRGCRLSATSFSYAEIKEVFKMLRKVRTQMCTLRRNLTSINELLRRI